MLPDDLVPARTTHHEMPRDVAAHDHDFFEIALVTQGHGRHLTAEGEQTVDVGSVVLIPPNRWHAYSDCDRLSLYNCFIGPELFDGPLAFLLGELELVGAFAHRAFPAAQSLRLGDDQISSAIAELDALRDGRRTTRAAAVGHVIVLLDLLNRAWMPTKASARHSLGGLHRAVARAAEAMESALDRPWTLAELAELARVERTHLARLFQRELGISPIAYLNQLRNQEAARLLVQTSDPVAHIGTSVGWEDAAHFARRFKAAYGLSPRAYRSRALAGDAGH